MNETLRQIFDELLDALAPLVNAADDGDQLLALLADLGWTPSSVPQPLRELADAGADLLSHIGQDPDSIDSKEVLEAIIKLIDAISAIATRADSLFPSGIDVAAFKSTIGRELLDYVLVAHLMRNRQRIGGILKLVGLIRLTPVPAAGMRKTYLKREVVWSRFGDLFTDPAKGFREVFDWSGTPKLPDLIADFTSLLDSYGLHLGYFAPQDQLATFVNQGALSVPLDTYGAGFELSQLLGAPDGVSAGIQIVPRPATNARGPALSIMPYAALNGATSIPITDRVSLTLRGNADFSGGIAITIAPDKSPEISSSIFGGAPVIPGEARLGLKIAPPGGQQELILLGAPDATRFSLASLELSLGGRVLDPSRLEVAVELALEKARLVIKPDPDDADSFLAKLLPEGGIDAALSFGLRFSNLSGFQFTGSGGLQVNLPLHIQLGPIDIQGLSLEVSPVDKGLALDAGATLAGELGPLAVAFDGVGLRLIARFPDPPQGNLGPMDLSVGFKPPKGVGLSIDAAVIKGGGYLFIDTERGEYAGVLELIVADWLNLHAIGLISTKMPDGSKGFSLLVIITAEFGTGLQLGYGFTLIGVGGLLGLNRTMLFQPLMDGVRSGTINGIMFPQDIIANAPRIISDLKQIFPPQEGTFLIGPMAKLGWGTPTLISLSLGVIIEIPPGDIAILGVLRLAIPDDEPLVVLQVNFAGALEFSKKRLYFFASLYDSRIVFITIEGEMGLLFAYGADANFVLSVGGFHPLFAPPPLPFPTPRRIQLNVLNESYARIRCEGYFAATTNSIQFGAAAEFYFGFDAVSVNGHSSFDALFTFPPLHVTIQVTTTFSVNVFGVGVYGLDIDVTLEGTSPWHVHGHGSLSFFLFSVSVPIDHTWGEPRDTSLPPIPIFPLLVDELGKAANWRAVLPYGANLLVSLRKLDPTETALLLHPLGTLQVSQRAMPLDLTLDKVGAQTPNDANHFTLDVTSAGLIKVHNLQEQFAPAQFKNFDDAAKLSQPAYAPLDSGVELGAGATGYASGTAITRKVRYDLTVLDVNYARQARRFFIFIGTLFNHFVASASVSRNALSAASKSRMQPVDERVAMTSETYTVAWQENNRAVDAQSSFTSRTMAEEHLERAIAADPARAGKMHVLPDFEVAA